MRFPRQAKIFRGQLDAAPVAAVFFLLVLMLLLTYSQTFIPGVRIDLQQPGNIGLDPERTIRVLRTGQVAFGGTQYDIESLETLLREQNQLRELPRAFFFEVEPGAATNVVQRIENLALELGARLKPPGTRLELPEFAGFPGVTNPVVVLALNLNGQLFLQHQLVREDLLSERLASLKQQTDGPLTLVLQADKDVRHGKIMRVLGIASAAGIDSISIATRPAVQPSRN